VVDDLQRLLAQAGTTVADLSRSMLRAPGEDGGDGGAAAAPARAAEARR
jgi:hypothetical protein